MSYIFQKRKAWVCYMNNRSRPQNEIACPKASSWQPGTYKMEVLKRQTSFIRNSPKCSHTTFFLDLHVGYRFQSSVAVISIVIINHMIVGIRIIEPQTEHVQRMTLQPAPCLQPLSLGNVLWVREPFKLVKVKVLVTQPRLTLCNPMDNSSPSSSVPEILQARILEWVDIFFSRGSSQPRDWTQISHTIGRFFIWASRVYPNKNKKFKVWKKNVPYKVLRLWRGTWQPYT